MESTLALFSEICACIGEMSQIKRESLWSCLSHYSIQSKVSSYGFEDSVMKFISAKTVDGLSPKTLKSYAQVLCKFGNEIAKPPIHIKTEDIRTYITGISKRGLKKSSIQTHINILRSYFAWMQTEELIERNPMNKIKSLRIDKKGLRSPLTPEETERARNACKTQREKAIFEFLISTGCRLSEIVNIPVDSIDFKTRSLMVTGKGDKTRIVYFSVKAKIALLDYLELAVNKSILFTESKYPHGALQQRAIEKEIRTIGECAGIAHRLCPHRMRHTFATSALNCGVDIVTIQQLLGHEKLDTTQIYAKLSQTHIQDTYNKLIA